MIFVACGLKPFNYHVKGQSIKRQHACKSLERTWKSHETVKCSQLETHSCVALKSRVSINSEKLVQSYLPLTFARAKMKSLDFD